MTPSPAGRRGFTLAELLISASLTALLVAVVATAMHGSKASYDYNSKKADLVARARGVLDRIAHDVRCAEATYVSQDETAINVKVVLREPDGSDETYWRQYRKTWSDADGWVLEVYQAASAPPLPPDTPDPEVARAVLTKHVANFRVATLVTSTRSITETLSCRITATCGPNAGNQFTVPMKEGPYVIKLSQTQFDERPPTECVDYLPRPPYIPDENPDVYWLCLEDAQAPPVALPDADWDHNDFMLKVTEHSNRVDMEVHWGTAAYDRDVMGPDGELLYGDIGGTHTYTYVPYSTDSDAVEVELELQDGAVEAGATITATQRRSIL